MRHRWSRLRHGWWFALSGAALLAAIVAPSHAGSSSATLVWVHGDRAYVAAEDSAAWAPGKRVAVLHDADTAAVGVITGVLDGRLTSVLLTRGTIDPSRPLAYWSVEVERSSLVAPTLLRIGLPAHARGNLLLACSQVSLDTAFAAQGYRIERLGAAAYRAVRDTSARIDAPWPDTLLLRLHPDATDQAIALERGELDVAVFWPGECPQRLREHATWGDALIGVRSRGMLVARRPRGELGDAPGHGTPAIAAMASELFAGDLQPVAHDFCGTTDGRSARYVVEPTIPGHRVVQRLLTRRASAGATDAPLWRLELLDAPVRSAIALDIAAEVHPLFSLGCAVLCAPEHRALVQALGPSVFADAITCRRSERWP